MDAPGFFCSSSTAAEEGCSTKCIRGGNVDVYPDPNLSPICGIAVVETWLLFDDGVVESVFFSVSFLSSSVLVVDGSVAFL